MENNLKEIQENLYNSDLKTLEKNLDKLIEAKFEHSKEKHKQKESFDIHYF